MLHQQKTKTSEATSPFHRPRRNRSSDSVRTLVRETTLLPSDLVMPYFIVTGEKNKETISTLPGLSRWTIDLLIPQIKLDYKNGLRGVALFPRIEDKLKNALATESFNLNGFLPNAIKRIKDACPEMAIITDIALDPYSSDGHDGIVKNGEILNDETLEVLQKMALVQAHAGADIVAPSDMMDGRIHAIRTALDSEQFHKVGLLAYTAKYASAFYGPFRDALQSAPKSGDKKTYQMDPANRKEALRELELDTLEGADMVMVKPALSYLDIIADFQRCTQLPIAAYNVSGEYAMIKFAGLAGALDEKLARDEMLLSIKRAGAKIILSYFASEFAQELS